MGGVCGCVQLEVYRRMRVAGQDQFVWELCGIYLNHHVSHRFLHDPIATERAHAAFENLITRSLRTERKDTLKKRGTRKPN